ncbi:hypothetical protein [Ferruginibacter sp. SUN106]|uniref:hypothetical protein n=1 Tax=Ferruginibacter sp. SUN106 TaxID=2978348 RepID=UPI003D3659F7
MGTTPVAGEICEAWRKICEVIHLNYYLDVVRRLYCSENILLNWIRRQIMKTSLSVIEIQKGIKFPVIYKRFFENCSSSIPQKLIGTDLLNTNPDLNKFAYELLTEDNVDIFLAEDDIVFMMHQGYMFWYFKADGNPDPIVYGYYERKLTPDNHGCLSNFIKELTE